MNLFRKFILAVLVVSAFSGIVGCEGGCSDSQTSPEQTEQSN